MTEAAINRIPERRSTVSSAHPSCTICSHISLMTRWMTTVWRKNRGEISITTIKWEQIREESGGAGSCLQAGLNAHFICNCGVILFPKWRYREFEVINDHKHCFISAASLAFVIISRRLLFSVQVMNRLTYLLTKSTFKAADMNFC